MSSSPAVTNNNAVPSDIQPPAGVTKAKKTAPSPNPADTIASATGPAKDDAGCFTKVFRSIGRFFSNLWTYFTSILCCCCGKSDPVKPAAPTQK